MLKAQDLVLKAISPGIRIKFEPGIDIDVHNPGPGEDRALAKIRIHDPDPDKKGADLSRICDQLKKKTRGVASIYPYKVSKDTPESFVYDVIVDLSASPVFHETVVSADAGSLKVRSSSEKSSLKPPVPEISLDYQDNAKTAVDMLETVDARMFRKALDELGLARTSTLRLVLSRLQRSAIEPEELCAAAKAESEKLANSADLEELNRISAMDPADFLQPLIGMLLEETS